MKTTAYFQNRVLPNRPELRNVMHRIEEALDDPLRIEGQPDGRTRRWVLARETGKYLRVIVEPDGETIHNAFYDRRYKS